MNPGLEEFSMWGLTLRVSDLRHGFTNYATDPQIECFGTVQIFRSQTPKFVSGPTANRSAHFFWCNSWASKYLDDNYLGPGSV